SHYYFVLVLYVCFFFFFSSRRRHTRCYRDWSSDVCSSDLDRHHDPRGQDRVGDAGVHEGDRVWRLVADRVDDLRGRELQVGRDRSEERRVGKEGRCRWWTGRSKQNMIV